MERGVSDQCWHSANYKIDINKEYMKVQSIFMILLGSLHASLCIIFEIFNYPEARGFRSH